MIKIQVLITHFDESEVRGVFSSLENATAYAEAHDHGNYGKWMKIDDRHWINNAGGSMVIDEWIVDATPPDP